MSFFTKCKILIYCLLLFSIIDNGNTQKSQYLGFLLLKTGFTSGELFGLSGGTKTEIPAPDG